MALSAALQQHLSDRRKAYNARVANVRMRHPGLATDAFDAFLKDTLDPLLSHVLAAAPDRVAAFVDAGFDMALALTEHGWTGAQPRARIVERVWQEVAPSLAPAIARDPKGTLGALSNAAIQLAGEPGVRLDQWLGLLADLGDRIDSSEDLRGLAVMAAWRSGAAHLRNAALSSPIDPSLACAVTGAADRTDWPVMVAQYQNNRWWTPDRSARSEGHLIGAFTGFGGHFAEPPRLAVADDALIVTSWGRAFLLDADAYGATLRPLAEGEVGNARPSREPAKIRGGAMQAEDRLIRCDWPEEGLVQASTADTTALVSPFSHCVRVFARSLP